MSNTSSSIHHTKIDLFWLKLTTKPKYLMVRQSIVNLLETAINKQNDMSYAIVFDLVSRSFYLKNKLRTGPYRYC